MPRTPADLRRTFLAIDHLLYDDRLSKAGVKVKWKRYRPTKNFLLFGDFDGDTLEIRLNWRLAQDDVPNYVVAAVLNHECLHYIVGLEHTVEFMKRDAEFVHYWESEAFCDRLVIGECSVED